MPHTKLKTRKYRYSPLTRYGRLLLRKINRSFREFDLITNDDRVCVAVSGGKDSLSLLHLLIEHKRFYACAYSLKALHVVSDFNPDAGRIKEYLRTVFEQLDIEYEFLDMEVTKDSNGTSCDPSCFWCSRRRREALFRYCAHNGYNKLAFGHHSDDVAETTLLNLIYHGTLETMLPRRVFFDGAFTVIRPLFYIKEKELVRYATMAGFKQFTCSCPNENTGKRRIIKTLLRNLSRESHQLNANLWRAAQLWFQTFGDRPLHKH